MFGIIIFAVKDAVSVVIVKHVVDGLTLPLSLPLLPAVILSITLVIAVLAAIAYIMMNIVIRNVLCSP